MHFDTGNRVALLVDLQTRSTVYPPLRCPPILGMRRIAHLRTQTRSKFIEREDLRYKHRFWAERERGGSTVLSKCQGEATRGFAWFAFSFHADKALIRRWCWGRCFVVGCDGQIQNAVGLQIGVKLTAMKDINALCGEDMYEK